MDGGWWGCELDTRLDTIDFGGIELLLARQGGKRSRKRRNRPAFALVNLFRQNSAFCFLVASAAGTLSFNGAVTADRGYEGDI